MNLPNSITLSRIATVPVLIWVLSPHFPVNGPNGEQELIASGIFIHDDPRRVRGPRSRVFDGEGTPTAARALIEAIRQAGVYVAVIPNAPHAARLAQAAAARLGDEGIVVSVIPARSKARRV